MFPHQKKRLTRKRKPRTYTRRTRIRIPQPKQRVFSFRSKDVLRETLIKKSAWWFTMHRRGVARPWVGEDPMEARAVPRWQVIGFLRERIVYRWLVEKGHLIPGADFTFQSSMMGGRSELGGMVVDFIFPQAHWALQVDGPTHKEALRAAKDEEQRLILAAWGYRVANVSLEIVDDEGELNNYMRRFLNLYSMGPGGPEFAEANIDKSDIRQTAGQSDLDRIWAALQGVRQVIPNG